MVKSTEDHKEAIQSSSTKAGPRSEDKHTSETLETLQPSTKTVESACTNEVKASKDKQKNIEDSSSTAKCVSTSANFVGLNVSQPAIKQTKDEANKGLKANEKEAPVNSSAKPEGSRSPLSSYQNKKGSVNTNMQLTVGASGGPGAVTASSGGGQRCRNRLHR